jgi:hypothetical protein
MTYNEFAEAISELVKRAGDDTSEESISIGQAACLLLQGAAAGYLTLYSEDDAEVKPSESGFASLARFVYRETVSAVDEARDPKFATMCGRNNRTNLQ